MSIPATSAPTWCPPSIALPEYIPVLNFSGRGSHRAAVRTLLAAGGNRLFVVLATGTQRGRKRKRAIASNNGWRAGVDGKNCRLTHTAITRVRLTGTTGQRHQFLRDNMSHEKPAPASTADPVRARQRQRRAREKSGWCRSAPLART